MAIRRKQGILFLLAGLSFALLVLDRIVLTPLAGAWKERTEKISELGESIEQAELLVEREQSYRRAYQEALAARLPVQSSDAEIEMLKALQRWTEESGLRLSSYRPRFIEGEDDRSRLECRASGDGSIENAARFLYAIESDPLAVRLESVELLARNPNGSELSLQVRLSSLLRTEETP